MPRHRRQRDRRRRGAVAGAVVAAAGVVAVVVGLVAQEPDAPPPPAPPATASAGPSAAAPVPSPVPSPGPSPAPVEEAPAVLPASPPVGVRIPSLGIDTPLVTLGLDAAGSMQVPEDGGSVGWYDQSPTPGERGPTVLAGHVSWQKRAGVFFDLVTLEPGSVVEVPRADGRVVTYEVTAVDQYAKDAFPTLRVYGNTEGPELRLITCGGDFDEEVGHYRDNVVVSARVVALPA